jgi:hypothetical protein
MQYHHYRLNRHDREELNAQALAAQVIAPH